MQHFIEQVSNFFGRWQLSGFDSENWDTCDFQGFVFNPIRIFSAFFIVRFSVQFDASQHNKRFVTDHKINAFPAYFIERCLPVCTFFYSDNVSQSYLCHYKMVRQRLNQSVKQHLFFFIQKCFFSVVGQWFVFFYIDQNKVNDDPKNYQIPYPVIHFLTCVGRSQDSEYTPAINPRKDCHAN